jgi:hypothetical protein
MCLYCGIAGHWVQDFRKKRDEAHPMHGATNNDNMQLMMQVCTMGSAPQLQVATRQSTESGTLVLTGGRLDRWLSQRVS